MGRPENYSRGYPSLFSFGSLLFLVFIFALGLSETFHWYRYRTRDVQHHPRIGTMDLPSFPDLEYTEGREDLANLLTAAADLLDILSTQHNLHSLTGLSNDLRVHASNAEKSSLLTSASSFLKGRDLLSDFTGLFGGGAGESGTSGAASSGLTSALTSGISSALSSIGGKILDSLAGPAQYLGDGVGRGAATGLNLSTATAGRSTPTPTGINAIADNLGFGVANGFAGSLNLSNFTPDSQKLVDAGNALGSGLGGGAVVGLKLNGSAMVMPNMTGIAALAGSLGSGLTQSFLGGVDLSKLTAGMNISTTQVSDAIAAAGKGLGSGAAQGITALVANGSGTAPAAQRRQTSTASGLYINTIVEKFTSSLASSFLSSVNLKAVTSTLGSSMGTSSNSTFSTGMIAAALGSAGSGLGSGVAVGLGLQKDTTGMSTSSPASFDISRIARDFTFQLSTSFLQNGTLSSLGKSISSSESGGIMAMLGPIAQGAGTGIGKGAAIGLGLQETNTAPAPMGGDAAMAAYMFTLSLTDSFLTNGSVSKLTTAAQNLTGNSSSLGLKSVSISKAAEGLARGLVDGVEYSINNAGGFQQILNGGNTTSNMADAPTNQLSAGSSSFNDTVGGAATGFGRGLGSETAVLVLQAFGENPTSDPTSTAALGPTSQCGNTSVIEARLASRTSPRLVSSINKRAIDLSDIYAGLNITAIDNIIQKGTDSLTCEGVGGLLSILLGLQKSKTLPTTSGDSNLTGILPNATFTITNEGTRYDVNPRTISVSTIHVNGMGVIKFALVLVFHIILMIAAYLVAIPTALLFESGRAIAVMIGRPEIWTKAPKWQSLTWGFIVLPLSVIGLVLGFLIIGSEKHFTSPHGILGVIAFALTLLAGILELPRIAAIPTASLARGLNLGVLLALSVLLLFTGFADLSKVSLCVTNAVIPSVAFVALGALILFSLVSALTVVVMRFLIQRWLGRSREKRTWGEERPKIEIVRGVKEIKSMGI